MPEVDSSDNSSVISQDECSSPSSLDEFALLLQKLSEQKANRDQTETPLQKWRRVARLVRIFCAVCIALRKYAMDAGLMENYLVAVTTRKAQADSVDGQLEELTFSLKDFQMKRELRVPSSLVEVMERQPGDRTDAEIHAISRLMRNLPSFKKYTQPMQLLLSKIVRYQKCERRRVVLRKGHLGYSVYFIYSGSVTVTLDTDEENAYVEGDNMCLRKGTCFGEIALVRDTRRNATVVCAEECEFLVVDKDDFVDNGLYIRSEEEFSHRREFFRHWPPFENVSEEDINSMTYISRTEDFNHNKIIIKDSRDNEWLWFVVKGSCEILRLVDLKTSPNYTRIVNLHASASKPLSGDVSRNRVRSAPNKVRSRPTSSSPATITTRPQTSLGLARELSHAAGDRTSTRSVITNIGMSRSQSCKRNHVSRVGFTDPDSQIILDSTDAVQPDHQRKGGEGDESPHTRVYVRVDILRDGQGFGLEGLMDGHNPLDYPQYSMVSKGCTVVHLSRNKLREMLDDKTIKRIEPFVKTYPSDQELCNRFLSKSEWDHYKHSLVENVVMERQNNATYINSIRNCQQPEYNARFESDQMTSQFYTPLTSRVCTPVIGSFALNKEDVMGMTSRRLRSAVGCRRPKTASPHSTVVDTDAILMKEADRYGRTGDRVRISSSPVGKHKLWAAKLKHYTGQKSRSSSAKPRVAIPPETRLPNAVVAAEHSKPMPPIIARPGSANQGSEYSEPRRKGAGNHVVIVSTKPIAIGATKEHRRVLAQPATC